MHQRYHHTICHPVGVHLGADCHAFFDVVETIGALRASVPHGVEVLIKDHSDQKYKHA